MLKNDRLVVGTRGSKLALIQVGLVADALKRQYPELVIETKIITTKGDTDQSPIPLDTVGKTWFTAEIEQALISGEIDLAIHSLKDMSLDAPEGLTTLLVLERADPRDAFISKSGKGLDDLPAGAIIGTDSVRRKASLLDRRPDLAVKSVRGNVDSRLRKLQTEDYDALVLAAAGLERLGMLDVVTEFFDATLFSIASGQGVLAAQVRADRSDLAEMLRGIEHSNTRIAAEAELAFSRVIGGGCKMPVGCYVEIKGDLASIYGMMGDLATNKVTRRSVSGPKGEATKLAEELAKKFI